MENPRILITGASGFVGARAMIEYPQAVAVPGALVREPGEALAEFIRANQPDIIINAAAISDIGACERDPEASYTANVALPALLAKAAREAKARFASFSTDQVYTGCREEGPYAEDDPLPPPANVYARHKLEAEQRVLDIHPESVLLRATWMYDMPLYHHANRGNLLVNVMNAALRGEKMRFPAHQHRGITYVRQAAELLEAASQLPGGVYNYGSENPLTMADTVLALLNALGLSHADLVEPTDDLRHNLWMDCRKLRAQGLSFDTTVEGFLRCAKDYGLRG